MSDKFKLMSIPHEWLTKPPPGTSLERDGFVIDRKSKTIDVWWGGYEYSVEFKRINTRTKCLEWVAHFGDKVWEGMTPERIGAFIREVAKINRWKIHGLG